MMRNFPTIDLLCFIGTKYFVLGVDGKELATYTNNSLEEWYVWGTDMVGKIKGNTKYYFFKDHLGSVRAVVDNNFNLVSAVDYDMWGDKMQGRIYNGDSTKFGFTGKEEDEESFYDFFGARYYDSRIGRWGGLDKMLEVYFSFSPYNYTLCNPLTFVDKKGLDVELPFDENQREMALNYIRMGLPKEVGSYINYQEVNGRFLINRDLINSAPIISGSAEFNALIKIVNNSETVQINLINTGDAVERQSSYGVVESFIFQEYQKGLTVMSGNLPNSNTFYPTPPKSLSGKTEVYINLSNSEQGTVAKTAHELYGHSYPYIQGQRWEHYYVGDEFVQRISIIEENSIKNFNNR